MRTFVRGAQVSLGDWNRAYSTSSLDVAEDDERNRYQQVHLKPVLQVRLGSCMMVGSRESRTSCGCPFKLVFASIANEKRGLAAVTAAMLLLGPWKVW